MGFLEVLWYFGVVIVFMTWHGRQEKQRIARDYWSVVGQDRVNKRKGLRAPYRAKTHRGV